MNTDTLGYASFGRRLGAVILDAILLNIVTLSLTFAIFGAEHFTAEGASAGLGEFIVTWILPAAITITFWLTLAATPGKLLLGIKVVNAETGEPLTFAQAVIRYLGYIVSMVPLLVGYFWMLRHPRRQTWHDILAKSVVVHRDQAAASSSISSVA